MTDWPLVYVVILNWNLKDETAECAESVLQLDYPNVRALIVDNGSTDGSVECLRSRFAQIDVIANERNLGFTGGNNLGIRYGLEHGADYVFILNNDTIVDRYLLSELVKVGEMDSRVGIAGPLILYHEDRNRIWDLGAREHGWLPVPLSIGRGQTDRGQFSSPLPLDYVTGCAMLVRRQVFDAIGLFESEYFSYYEDNDFCRRAREAGFKIMGVPSAKLWHKVALTSSKVSALARYLKVRNRMVFYQRYPHGPSSLLTKLYLVADAVRMGAVDLTHGQLGLLKPLARGLYDGCRGDLSQLLYYE